MYRRNYIRKEIVLFKMFLCGKYDSMLQDRLERKQIAKGQEYFQIKMIHILMFGSIYFFQKITKEMLLSFYNLNEFFYI